MDSAPRVEVLPLDHEEDALLTRNHLLRLHTRRGASVLLDLRRTRLEEAGPLVEELDGVARGNGQRVLVLGGGGPEEGETCRNLSEGLEAAVPDLTFRVTLPCRPEYIPELRRFFSRRVGERFGEVGGFRLEVVLDELCLNAVEHSPSRDSRFEVESDTEGKILHLKVSNDHSGPHDSSRIMNRRIREFDSSGTYMGERGRGLFLIARLVDGMNIRTGGGRVQVHVWKDLGGGKPREG
jgi:anti-sigma regulatory factor (Ser/Thr protein kinase)